AAHHPVRRRGQLPRLRGALPAHRRPGARVRVHPRDVHGARPRRGVPGDAPAGRPRRPDQDLVQPRYSGLAGVRKAELDRRAEGGGGGGGPPAPPLPPFDEQTARQKVQAAEDAWNTRDPERVALAYTEDSVWRNRHEFVTGRAEIVEFLRRKWDRELDYALRKDLWAFAGNRIAVRLQYASRDASARRC